MGLPLIIKHLLEHLRDAKENNQLYPMLIIVDIYCGLSVAAMRCVVMVRRAGTYWLHNAACHRVQKPHLFLHFDCPVDSI